MDTRSDRSKGKSRATAYFLQHVVPVYLLLVRGAEQHPVMFTTFAVAVRGRWMLVTAGHCIRDVETMMSRGWQVKFGRLFDTMGLDAKHLVPATFDYVAAGPLAPFNDERNDYGWMFLNAIDQMALQANGIVPITEQAWDCEMGTPDGYFMTGMLGEMTRLSANQADVTVLLLGVQELDARPESFPPTEAIRWYGRVLLPTDGPSSLVGMSGGPIFATKRVDGALKYWLHALQSAQAGGFPHPPFIAANLARPLLTFIAEAADRIDAEGGDI